MTALSGPFTHHPTFNFFLAAHSLKFTIMSALLMLLVHLPTFQPSSTHHTRQDRWRCCSGFRLGNWQGKVSKYESALTSIDCMAML